MSFVLPPPSIGKTVCTAVRRALSVLGTLLLLGAVFSSCSLFENVESTGKVKIALPASLSRALEEARENLSPAEESFEGFYIDVELSGAYSAKQTAALGLTYAPVVFEKIPAPVTLTIKACVYTPSSASSAGESDETADRIIYYDAEKEVSLTPGENEISLLLEHSKVPYVVHHLLEKLEPAGEYEESLEELETLLGKYTFQTEAAAKEIPGFTAQSFEQKTIAFDGSTEVSIKYTRNSYTVSYDAAGGTGDVPETASYRYGATVFVDFGTLTREGYEFTGWSDGTTLYSEAGNSFVMGAADVTLTAVWKGAGVSGVTVTFDEAASDFALTESWEGTVVTLTAPAGYSSYTWTKDGVTVGDVSTNAYSFETSGQIPGSYIITVLAMDAAGNAESAYVTITVN